MSLELKSMKNLLEIKQERLSLFDKYYPINYRYNITAICRKARCRHCTITFSTSEELSLSVLADLLVEPFSLLCAGLVKVAKEEKNISGKRKVKSAVSDDDDFEVNWEDWR